MSHGGTVCTVQWPAPLSTTPFRPSRPAPRHACPARRAFDIQFRTWTQMPSGGDDPGARMGHSMVVDGTLVYVSGGYTYEEDTALWVTSSDVYYVDLRLGFGTVWTQLAGDSAVLQRNSAPTALVSGVGISTRRHHLASPNNKVRPAVIQPVSQAVRQALHACMCTYACVPMHAWHPNVPALISQQCRRTLRLTAGPSCCTTPRPFAPPRPPPRAGRRVCAAARQPLRDE